MKYVVTITEKYNVEAENEDEAIKKALEREDDEFGEPDYGCITIEKEGEWTHEI